MCGYGNINELHQRYYSVLWFTRTGNDVDIKFAHVTQDLNFCLGEGLCSPGALVVMWYPHHLVFFPLHTTSWKHLFLTVRSQTSASSLQLLSISFELVLYRTFSHVAVWNAERRGCVQSPSRGWDTSSRTHCWSTLSGATWSLRFWRLLLRSLTSPTSPCWSRT